MSTVAGKFQFSDGTAHGNNGDCFLLRVPSGIQSTAELLSALSYAGHFPENTGVNWDSLEDCFRDFSWIINNIIVIIHEDLPISEHIDDCRTYLEILANAKSSWQNKPIAALDDLHREFPYVEHELLIVFPVEVYGKIYNLLYSSKNK